ncbi:MAG TPA: hypothetical protein VEC06_18970 [Paucimonas sp.]|nr:hypothetical protein [Paucimonas sp.]
MRMTTLAAAGALLFSANAHAHYLWLESAGGNGKLYFGEADAQVKEKSPGKLDSFKAPKAYAIDAGGKRSEAALTRAGDHFAIATGGAHAIAVVDESFDVRDMSKSGLGFAKSNYYARHGQPSSNSSAALPLDVVSRGGNGYTLLYRGQPLARTKIEVIAPNTWRQEHQTNAQGQVEINTPWRGQYVMHVLHVDKSAGEFGGKKYDLLRNHFTYSFVRADGADPGPAVPPKHAAD